MHLVGVIEEMSNTVTLFFFYWNMNYSNILCCIWTWKTV